MMKRTALLVALVGAIVVFWSGVAGACGGFFCQNDPVDQTGERIVFTVNPDDTVTALIEILYQGEAADFSWILPIPDAIDADALAVPEDGQAVFDELHQVTDVQLIAPELPDCAQDVLSVDSVADAAGDGGVDIFASGEVGPFGFDVIGSDDPNALIDWLRDSNYRVTPEMEPLINVYVEEQSAFIAVRLLDGETADSIQPIEITYPGSEPVIPLRLTAVAAQPNLPIWVWIFGENRAVPTNFASMEIATEEITFFPFGGNDYIFLVQQRANALDGQAFITEYAQPANAADFTHPWLIEQSESSNYLTRLNTYIDPEEMTVDPTFGFDESLDDVSNIRDATGLSGLYSCERDSGGVDGFFGSIFGGGDDAIDPTAGSGQVVAFTPDASDAEDDDPVQADPVDSELDDDGLSTEQNASAGNDLGQASGTDTTLVLIVAIVALTILGVAYMAFRPRKQS